MSVKPGMYDRVNAIADRLADGKAYTQPDIDVADMIEAFDWSQCRTQNLRDLRQRDLATIRDLADFANVLSNALHLLGRVVGNASPSTYNEIVDQIESEGGPQLLYTLQTIQDLPVSPIDN